MTDADEANKKLYAKGVMDGVRARLEQSSLMFVLKLMRALAKEDSCQK